LGPVGCGELDEWSGWPAPRGAAFWWGRKIARLLIIDDDEAFAEALRLSLERDSAFDVVGVSHDGKEAIEFALAREPDVILVDALMPGLDGFEVIRELRRAGSAAKAIVLSGGEPVEMSEAALAARADAYVAKAAAHTLLLDVIHRLAGDETLRAEPDR
jgi:DNA-binding NarL/FixJ family response regulator